MFYEHMDTPVLADLQKLTREDSGCCEEDLPRAMANRDRWQERVKESCQHDMMTH